MGNEALNLKTDANLLSSLKSFANKKQTQKEFNEQRISFVYGLLDAKSNVTKEKIREVILNEEGLAA